MSKRNDQADKATRAAVEAFCRSFPPGDKDVDTVIWAAAQAMASLITIIAASAELGGSEVGLAVFERACGILSDLKNDPESDLRVEVFQ